MRVCTDSYMENMSIELGGGLIPRVQDKSTASLDPKP